METPGPLQIKLGPVDHGQTFYDQTFCVHGLADWLIHQTQRDLSVTNWSTLIDVKQ